MNSSLDSKNNLSPVKQALLELREMRSRLEVLETQKTEPIAIIGMGCRLPGGAHNPEAFWQLLSNGVDAITEIPAERWNVDAFYNPDPNAPGKMYTRFGGFLEQVDQFDPDFFGISAREARCMDPQQRLLLEVAWEALEDAGLVLKNQTGHQTGVFIGVASSDYRDLQFSNLANIDTYSGIGTSNSVVAGRLSYLLNLQGPSLAIDTACSSSLVAVHLACESLRNRECHTALAGGVNLILQPEFMISICKMGLPSIDGRCKTFDEQANGIVLGEGCGIILLKRFSDALSDRDRILALIRGSAVNQDGYSNGLTAPNASSQQALIRQALKNAKIEPSQVTYIEAHGTGTLLGDPIEVEALNAVYGQHNFSGKPPCILGSVKTNIGHLATAAGISGLMKVVLSLQHRAIPSHLHLQKINPHLSLEKTPFVISTEHRPWTVETGQRYAAVSSFGWSGTNAHVILEEAPQHTSHEREFDGI